ncbi:MFS transporter [Jatrophihabitans sp. YIM 134969]
MTRVDDAPVEQDGGTAPSILAGRYRTTTLGIVITITLVAFEGMAVATALPSAAKGVDGVAGYGWLFTGFLVANMVGMVAGGGLSDRRGPRVPLVAGLIGFCVGLVVAGAAVDLEVLVLGRVIQGVSGGMMITALYVVIGSHYPTALQPKMMAAISSAWVVPSLIGPVVSGALTQTVGWRWVFWGIAPFVIVAGVLLVPALRGLAGGGRADAPPVKARLVLAFVVAAGVALFQQAGHVDIGAAVPLAVGGVVVVVVALLGLLPTGWWKLAPGVSGPVVMRGVLAGAFFGLDALVPLTLQTQHGFSPLEAGIPLTCGSLTWALGSWIQGRERWTVTQRVRLMQGGLLCIAVGAAGMATVAHPSVWPWIAVAAQGVAGLGVGLGITAVSVLLLRFTTDADRGRDSSSMQLCDAVGAALATGFGGILVALAAGGALGYGAAFTVVDLAMAGVALLGALAARRLRPARSVS